MKVDIRRWAAPLCLSALVLVPALAQGTSPMRAAYERAVSFMPGNLQREIYVADVSPHWIGRSDSFWFVKIGPNGKHFIKVDAAKNTQGPAFAQARLAAVLSRATGKTYEANDLPFYSFTYLNKDRAIRFHFDDSIWACTLAKYSCHRSPISSAKRFMSISPNGQWGVFIRHHNLFVRDMSTGTVSQLTFHGVAGDAYGMPLPDLRLLIAEDVTNGDDVRERPGVSWSPNSERFVTYRMDSRNAGRFTSIQFVPPHQLRPITYNYVYPSPGEILPKAMPIVFNLQTAIRRVDVKTRPLQIQFQGGPHFRWFPDNQHFYYVYHGRGEKYISIRVVNADTGVQRVLYTEVAKPYPYVDPRETMFRFFNGYQELLWTSQRSGWNQLYRYNGKTGQLIDRVTHGNWVVHRIVKIDGKAHKIFFLAGGVDPRMNPYYTQLYSINMNGSGMKLLTPENADHTVSVSPDGEYFVDDYSRPNLPAISVLRRARDGSVVRVLERTDDGWLLKMGWKPPIPFEGKAADGKTNLYGIIVRPTDFNPHKKYPILENIYPGPQGHFVPNTFGAALRLQSMAELGFVAVMIDGRGTSGRSRAFHDFSYHNMGNVFIDHVAMIKQMAAKYPWMNIHEIGIHGISAGGYGSAHAFLQFPGFYKVCVSISGDHDPRLAKAWWNELYQGYPVGKDYKEQANETIASRLKGHLLLIHGDIDDNVNPTETMRLVNALMNANKDFQMLLVPNMYHGPSGPHALYVVRREWDFFARYLLKQKPPGNFVIREAPFHSFKRR